MLEKINIETIRDLVSRKTRDADKTLRGKGGRLHEFANGIDNNEVIEEYETKSIGRDTSFEKDLDDEDEEQILESLMN